MISQEKFLSNARNKISLITLLTAYLQRTNVSVLQADDDVDRLIVITAIRLREKEDLRYW